MSQTGPSREAAMEVNTLSGGGAAGKGLFPVGVTLPVCQDASSAVKQIAYL